MTTFNCDRHSFPIDFECGTPQSPPLQENVISQVAIKALEKPARRSPMLAIVLPAATTTEKKPQEQKKRVRIEPIKVDSEERPKKKEKPALPPIHLPLAMHQYRDEQNLFSSHTMPSGQTYLKLKTEVGAVNFSGVSKTKKNAIKVRSDDKPSIQVARLVSHDIAAFDKIEKEYNLLSQFKGDRGIIQVYDLVNMPNKNDVATMTLYEENCNQGDLINYLSQNENRLPPQIFPKLAEDWIYGLKTIHDKGIAHRDIKPDNLLIHQEGNEVHGKICDFDLAISTGTGKTAAVGTENFSSPEKVAAKLNRNGIWECNKEPKSDVWSMGVALYLMYSGQSVLWYDLDETQTNEILEGYSCLEGQGSFFAEPDSVADPTFHLIWKMCQYDPNHRLNMYEVKAHWDAIPAEKRDLRIYTQD